MRFVISLCIASCLSSIFANNFGAQNTALGNTGLSNHDVFSAFNNVASTAFCSHTSYGFSAQNNYLFPNLLQAQNAFILQKEKLGAFSFTQAYSGYSKFYRNDVGIGYARKFGAKLSLGLSFQHHFLSINSYGSTNVLSLQAGILYCPSEYFRIAIAINNPIKHKLEKNYKSTLPSSFQIGSSYHPSDKFHIAVELMKDLKNPLTFKLGLQYQIHPVLYLRLGANLHPSLLTFGLGFNIHKLQLDLSSTWNLNLGYSPQLSLRYAFFKS